jgi:hypothetical protein
VGHGTSHCSQNHWRTWRGTYKLYKVKEAKVIIG